MPSMVTAVSVLADSAVPSLQVTALADKKKSSKTKTDNKKKGGGKKTDGSGSKASGSKAASTKPSTPSGDQQQTSPWDQALQTLAKSATSEDDDQKDANATDSGNIAGHESADKKEAEQANIDALGGATGNVT